MTLKKFRDLVGRLTLWALLALTNMFLILKRAAEPSGSVLEQASGLSMDPVLIASAAIALTVPPLWLGRNFPRLRTRFSGYTGLLLLVNGLALLGLLLAGPPPASPQLSPSPMVRETPRLPVQPTRRTTLVREVTPPPAPAPVASPTPEATRTPALISTTPTPTVKTPEETPYAKIDAHALAAPESVEGDIAKLAQYLVEPARNDREKIRAIHRWVADRVAYDTVSFFKGGDYPDQSAENTLRTRLSVCAGYANLVHALAEAGGVETVVVSGYARDADSTGEKSDNDRHAWNAVKLDGDWRLLDTTWSAGSVGEDQKFSKEFDDFYFLTDPKAFLNSHRPTDDKWQLVEPAISWEDFQRQPLLRPDFYTAGLGLSPGITLELKAEPVAVLAVDVPEGVLLMANLEDDRGVERKGAVKVFRQGTRTTVSVKAPEAGDYRLSLFAGSDQSNNFEGVAEFKVSASRGDKDGYPEIFTSLQEAGGKISAPMEGVVTPGPQQFDLEIPGATKVFIDDWDRTLQREGDRFTGEIDLQVGEAKVYAQFDGPRAEQVASYRVRYKPEGEN